RTSSQHSFGCGPYPTVSPRHQIASTRSPSIADRTASSACRLACTSEMTATRMVRGATIAVGAAVWLLLAFLLWRTTVPAGLHLPHLDERQVFGSGLVRRAVRFERFLDWNWVLATVAAISANLVMVRRGRSLVRSFGLGPVNA